MTRSYTMRGSQGTADRAVALARSYLAFRDPRSRVHDVQLDPRFQHRGVDLLWERSTGVVGVEVKGDRHRGRYFLELVSNLEKDTPGCFLYSAADLFVYVFVRDRELHELPLGATRTWFLERAKAFPLRRTQTRLGEARYTTVGAVVPVKAVLEGVPGAVRYRATGEVASPSWEAAGAAEGSVGHSVARRRPSSTRRAR